MAELENPEVMSKMMGFLCRVLEGVAQGNDFKGIFLKPQRISVFDGLTKPAISIKSYMERIFKYANCSPSCLVVAYIYLDRFSQKQPLLPLHSFNLHRFIITSVLLSAKFMDDLFYDNAFYAKIGGISTREMNILEVDFLFGIGFQLNVTPNTFYTYCSHIQREMILESPPLQLQPKVDILRPIKPHCCIIQEDETPPPPPPPQQLAV